MVDNYIPSLNMNEQKTIDKKIDKQLKQIINDVQDIKYFISVPTQRSRELYEMTSNKPKKAKRKSN